MLREIFDPIKPARKSVSNKNLLHILAPRSAHITRVWLEGQTSDGWRVVALLLGVVYTLCGAVLILGGWYTSIQGVRFPASKLGLVKLSDLWLFPAIYWWVLPPLITIAQVVPKALPGTRSLWWPATVYDGVTNSIFVALGILTVFTVFGHTANLIICSVIGSAIGLALAVFAERLFLSGLLILVTAFTWDERNRHVWP